MAKDKITMKKLIANLNDDLSGEYNAIISYLTYSAKVKGPYRPQLVEFFQSEIPDEQAHAQYLADKIVSLGGDPAVTPRPVEQSDDVREMLRYVYEAEAQTVLNYTQRCAEAAALGETALVVQLEDMINDETNHRDEVKKILDGWT